MALPAVTLNLALEYGAHPGFLHQPEDAPLALAALGALALGHWADASKAAHWAEAAPNTPPVVPACARGPWAWSRRPNYFAELLFHASVYGLVVRHTPLPAVLGVTLTAFICLLASGGAAGLEAQRHAACYMLSDYRAYRARTSPFVPLPPMLYAKVPYALRRLLFFEWPVLEGRGACPPNPPA